MKRIIIRSRLIIFGSLLFFAGLNSYGQLKSMVYDFDGLDIGQVDIPEGDYGFGDLSYQVSANPLAPADMIGDRVMQLNLNWNTGYGSFGRGVSRFIEFDPTVDVFNFFFYNPVSNGQSAVFDINIGDDDNQSNTFEYSSDDIWKMSVIVTGLQGWQRISIPLKDFSDSNPGGNGVFDIAFSQNKGMLCQVEFRFNKPNAGINNPVFYIDMINFSDGSLPHGTGELDLPFKSTGDYCLLGAFMAEGANQNYLIPSQFESLFPSVPDKKIKYVNFFQQWSDDGGVIPNSMPGSFIQTLVTNGYMPIITWEPMFNGHDRLDAVQPRLDNIINGNYDSYIDAFADKIKTFSDTVIIRFMHEFDGDWYSWSISQNGGDPQKYITAYRKVVDRFRSKGVTNVQWMWCVNSDYSVVRSYNWVVLAYPGDNYVDIVATDIYNNHYPISLPWWKSFRWQTAESYYYLNKYFPQKPLYICEAGCRERAGSENPASESKGNWYGRMDKELQSNFHKARALIFFDAIHEQNWFVNSSPGAIQSLINNIWYDDYYFKIKPPVSVKELHEYGKGLYIYPNPFSGLVTISYYSENIKDEFTIDITNGNGARVYSEKLKNTLSVFEKQIDLSHLSKGIYYVRMEAVVQDGMEKRNVTEVAKLIMQ